MSELWAARAVTPAGIERNVRVSLEGGRITRVVAGVAAGSAQACPREAILVPGLVDLQVNGAAGVSYADPDAAARRRATEFHLGSGTTCLVPTLISAPLGQLASALERLAQDVGAQAELAGIHLEGPFLSAEKAGAHDAAHLCDPAPGALARLLDAAGDALRILTLAPERCGALEAIETAAGRGVAVFAGHSRAPLERMRLAIERGLSGVTHLGNACEWPTRLFDAQVGYRRSEPGIIGAFLIDPRLRATLILDGHHLHPELARALVELRGRDAIALVSDASPAAGLAPGEYDLWDQRIRVDPTGFAAAGKGLAGSSIALSTALRAAVLQAGLDLVDAVHMASAIPARWVGLGERKGKLAPGFDADLLLLDSDLQPSAIWLAGQPVRPASRSS